MGRVHLFELEDQSWFPAPIREAMTDFLSFVGNLSDKPFRDFSKKLAEAMRATGDQTIIDLCSGGTGPVVSISRLLRDVEQLPVHVTGTDLYPNLTRFEFVKQRADIDIQMKREPVNALGVPEDLKGFRLICNAFHHFKPEDGRQILANAVSARRGIALIEMVNRSPPAIFSMLINPLVLLSVTPFIRPFKWSRLFFTYLVPLIPICTVWDGLVSCLRVYSPAEMRQLVASIDAPDYEWDIGELAVKNAPAKLTYLIGWPKSGSVAVSQTA